MQQSKQMSQDSVKQKEEPPEKKAKEYEQEM